MTGAGLTVGGAAIPVPARAVDNRAGLGPSATVTTSASGTSPNRLTDGVPTPSEEGVGASWTAPARAGQWVQLNWSSPQRVTSVQVYGAVAPAAVRAASITLSDGSAYEVGDLISDSSAPTTIAFPARPVTWVRYTVTGVKGSGDLGIAEMRAYGERQTPVRYAGAAPTMATNDPINPPCPAPTGTARAGVISVSCPIAAATVKDVQRVRFRAAGLTRVAVNVWQGDPAGTAVAERIVDVAPDGSGRVSIDLAQQQNGPITLGFRGVAGPGLAFSRPTYLQVYNVGRSRSAALVPAASAQGRSRTLVYAEEFNTPFTVSYDGRSPVATYAAGKPEPWGAGQFGEAVFPDPALGFDNLRWTGGRYLRILAQPNPAGYSDPHQWGRTSLGGLVASARPGGSGFAAQHGYFEVKMLAPAARGTWPAFWMLPMDNLVESKSRVAEIDALELYGHDPEGECHSTHSYLDGTNVDGVALCGRRLPSPDAMRWHVWGADVRPTEIVFYVDGREVARAPQVAGGEKPMFFLVNLALGGGWPVDLEPIQGRAAVYVDYVRVYV